MSETADPMAPAASPGEWSKKSGGRRVNNLPMYLFGGVLLMFLIVMALVAADRAAQQNAPADGPKEKIGTTSRFAQDIVGDHTGGMIAPAKRPVVPEMPTGPEPAPGMDTPPAPPLAPPGAAPGAAPGRVNAPVQDEEALRIRMAKLQQFEEAVKAKTGVQVGAPRSSGSAPGGRTTPGTPQSRGEILARMAEVRQQIDAQRDSNPTAAYQERLAQIRSMGVGGSGAGGSRSSAPPLLQTSAPADGNPFGPFAGNAGNGGNGGDRWKLDSQPEAPRSPYELRAGFVVPATLISGINSDLPGQIMAQVAQNVYDTPTGNHLLIPQGSRLVGAYSSEVKYGQARVLVAWQRIVFPDGKAMDLGAMPGADSAGYAGLQDEVNHHYVRVFGSALLMSLITGGITYSQGQSEADSVTTARTALSESLGNQLGQVTAQMIAKNMAIAPTLEIRPGYRFNIVVTKDMTFSKPYRSFDY